MKLVVHFPDGIVESRMVIKHIRSFDKGKKTNRGGSTVVGITNMATGGPSKRTLRGWRKRDAEVAVPIVGVATCHPDDYFCKREGIRVALFKALEVMQIDVSDFMFGSNVIHVWPVVD